MNTLRIATIAAALLSTVAFAQADEDFYSYQRTASNPVLLQEQDAARNGQIVVQTGRSATSEPAPQQRVDSTVQHYLTVHPTHNRN
jgi:hypothetical protein